MNTPAIIILKRIFFRISCLLFLIIGSSATYAQVTLCSTGNDLTGVSGKVSYSVGQSYILNTSGTDGHTINGIQQPFSIYTLGVNNNLASGLDISVYPNPTENILVLSINDEVKGQLEYCLNDIHGLNISVKPITEKKTLISMNNLPADTYILNVLRKGSLIKSFKIVKH